MLPEVIADQADVPPAEWGDMRENLIRHDPALGSQMLHRSTHVERVPVHDCRDQQVQSRGPVLGSQMSDPKCGPACAQRLLERGHSLSL